ncbi:GNAT family N-acetyltransferase [Pontibacter locisalis]|uniref:GNAT family N-acetyltransferase n=1 Tax=Pontibacter locisalis TaxID=1719035 RepID=A0ABW5ILV6_9BACT
MTKNINIRKATTPDIPVIKILAEETWEPTYSSILSKEQIDYMFDVIYKEEALQKQMQAGQTFLLLYEQDKPVGFASFSVKDQDEHIFKLNKIYLLPACQGKGYGKLLLGAVEEEVKAQGAHMLDLNVNRYNKAKDFYKRCGYYVYQQEDIPIGPYWMNDYIMRKIF